MKKITAVRKGIEYEIIVNDEFEYDKKISIMNNGYACITVDGKTVLLHRYIFGAKKGQLIDHKNGDKLDNRLENLRLANKQLNMANTKNKGVILDKRRNKFMAKIKLDGKTHFIGYYEAEDEAIKAYRERHIKEFGDYSPWKGVN